MTCGWGDAVGIGGMAVAGRGVAAGGGEGTGDWGAIVADGTGAVGTDVARAVAVGACVGATASGAGGCCIRSLSNHPSAIPVSRVRRMSGRLVLFFSIPPSMVALRANVSSPARASVASSAVARVFYLFCVDGRIFARRSSRNASIACGPAKARFGTTEYAQRPWIRTKTRSLSTNDR